MAAAATVAGERVCVTCGEAGTGTRPIQFEQEVVRQRLAELRGEPLGVLPWGTGRTRYRHEDCAVRADAWDEEEGCQLPDPALTDELLRRLRTDRNLLEWENGTGLPRTALRFWLSMVAGRDAATTAVMMQHFERDRTPVEVADALLHFGAVALALAEEVLSEPGASQAEWQDLSRRVRSA